MVCFFAWDKYYMANVMLLFMTNSHRITRPIRRHNTTHLIVLIKPISHRSHHINKQRTHPSLLNVIVSSLQCHRSGYTTQRMIRLYFSYIFDLSEDHNSTENKRHGGTQSMTDDSSSISLSHSR